MKKINKKYKLNIKLTCISSVFFIFIFVFFLNFIIQIYRKPIEILNFLSWSESKTINKTWMSYKKYFIKNSTENISPYFLASMAQVESSGNPMASPKWKFNTKRSLKDWFSPLSSSVGLYQFTQPTFEIAKNFCIYKNKSVKKGRWYQFNRCALNWAYFRIWPSHSIEIASGYLDYGIRKLLGSSINKVPLKMKTRLASVIHLCGEHRGRKFVQRSFKIKKNEHCGSHSLAKYILRLESLEKKLRTNANYIK